MPAVDKEVVHVGEAQKRVESSYSRLHQPTMYILYIYWSSPAVSSLPAWSLCISIPILKGGKRETRALDNPASKECSLCGGKDSHTWNIYAQSSNLAPYPCRPSIFSDAVYDYMRSNGREWDELLGHTTAEQVRS